jgi:serine/threonine protein kinase
VLSSPEQAKRVLREICILRRLTHPFIIELKNAFVQPSATGKLTLFDDGILQDISRLALVCNEDTANELLALQGQAD